MEVNYLDLLFTRRFDSSTKIPNHPKYFTIGNNLIGSAGNIVTLVGLPKAGKSSFLTAIIASGLIQRAVFDFELKLYPEQKKTKIAWFDTEQSADDFNRSMQKVKDFSCLPESEIYNYLDCFLVNSDTSKDILGMIESYLQAQPSCAILVLDGLLDVVDNLNDEREAKLIIRKLKKLAKDYSILIITVLHLGKKDLSSIGHIGSEADRRAQSVLNIEKTKNNSYICSAKMLRSAAGFTPIEIYYNTLSGKICQTFS